MGELQADECKNQMDESIRLCFERDRLDTFKKNWKDLRGFKHCTPKNFAAAGFYNHSSNSYSDNVKCFACQKELSNWEKNDDPWEEHVKRGTKCPFVIFQNKEQPTVQDFLQLHYEIKKIIMNNYFESVKTSLKSQQQALLKSLNSAQRRKR